MLRNTRSLSLVIGVVLLCVIAEATYLDGRGIRHFTLPTKIMTPIVGEPSCEDLRVMWRFSRRQSRVAEMTNEIPTYRDPFAYNIWGEYPRPQDIVGTLRSGGRSWNRNPIYGRIVQNAPKNHPRIANVETARAYEEVLRYLGNANTGEDTSRKPPLSAFRLSGGMSAPNTLSQSGSFQHLKKIIWAERAKELQQERLLEEAAAFKNIQVPVQLARAFGKHRSTSSFRPRDLDFKPRRSPMYLPMRLPSLESEIPLSRYYFNGPTYRKNYRYRPDNVVEEDTDTGRW